MKNKEEVEELQKAYLMLYQEMKKNRANESGLAYSIMLLCENESNKRKIKEQRIELEEQYERLSLLVKDIMKALK